MLIYGIVFMVCVFSAHIYVMHNLEGWYNAATHALLEATR